MRTNEQLLELVRDWRAGTIVTSLGMPEDVISSVFMPLVFLSTEQIKEMQDNDVVVLFEYLSQAGPRAINGYPTFMSFQTLTREEVAVMQKIDERLKAADAAVLENL